LSFLLMRAFDLKRYNKVTITRQNAPFWIKKIVLASALQGTIWGISLLLFMSIENPLHTGCIILLYFGMVASNVSSMSLYYRVHLSFVVPYTAGFIIKCLYIIFSTDADSYVFLLIGTSVVLYVVVLSSFARSTQSAFNKTTQLAFENSVLLNEILEEKATAENAVLAKNQFLAAASHDLRQPLHALGLYVGAFSSLKLDAEAKNIASEIKT